ncbi:MAG: hypothetical protein K9M98_00865 [Cephaloticoccus sp.]|nr:hypothetical protein [Cephaloticoccus sp.]MCF7759029.1 hypothetical protein [Cephaloticoccus sp.]
MTTKPRLHIYATAWSLREYPTPANEWSWARKFDAIRAAGFTGIMSPPREELRARGDLDYWAMGSLGVEHDPAPYFAQVKALGATHATIQPCDVETPLADAITAVVGILAAAKKAGMPTTIESHRNTFTETPERMWALYDGYREKTGEVMPVCFDHSHFAVVRHMAAPYWPKLNERPEIMRECPRFHMRPFNGHHCQIPATFDGTRRTPEYELWSDYAKSLITFLQNQSACADIHMVPELGNAAPAYGLSCFPDIWQDAQVVGADLRRWWDE